MRKELMILILYILVAAGLSFVIMNYNTISTTAVNSTRSSSIVNVTDRDFTTAPPIVSNQSQRLLNGTIAIPDNDSILKSIQWSKYPHVSNGRVTKSEIRGPNSVINHTFISTIVKVDITDPDNVPEVYRELSGIVMELRKILGEDSGPDVWGIANGMDLFHAIMSPYESTIYRYDYYHPVNNLTWSSIDASEIM